MIAKFRKILTNGFSLAMVLVLLITSLAVASSVDVAVVDVTIPIDAVTIQAGQSAPIVINLTVTGNQVGTATFQVNRDWTLSGGTFTGSNPQEFTVPAANYTAGSSWTTSTTGTITVAASQTAGGPFTLAVSAFNITNDNQTGAKLADGKDSSYKVTVTTPTPPSDITPPEITYVLNPTSPDGTNGWYKSNVSLTWTVSEPQSLASLVKIGCVDSNITADQAATTYSCSATSDGGSAGPVEVNIKRDATAPTISGSASPEANAAGWNKTDVDVTFACSDATSGIASCSPVQSLGEGVNQSATGTAVDNAGNSASATVSGINIDKTAPTATVSASPSANSYGWNNEDVTVSFSGSDDLSGIASCDAPVMVSTEGAGQSTSGTCTDNAGNESTPATATVSIDKTAPTVSLVGGPADGASYYFGSLPAAPTCSASDPLSGLDGSCSVSGYSAAVGSHTITASASDLAGNSASASASYTVLAWTLNGFYSPVDMNGVYNVVKGGSTVPLKFEVFAASELTSTSVVQSFVQTKIACNGTLPVDEIEVTTTGGTSLRYDGTAGQFIQNWQTPKLPGQCYRVTMTTQDGSSLIAFFKLK